MNNKCYFLGCTSPAGFQSKFGAQIDNRNYYTYILKGGPGTGKSTLMKKIAEKFSDHDVEVYYCSSDINSLDAVIIKDLGVIIVDGTAPHVFDPKYPAVLQKIVNLGEYWDSSVLNLHKESVIYCTDENAKCHSRTKRYVRAFSSLNSDIYSIAYNGIDRQKLDAYISRLSQKLFSKNNINNVGVIEYKQLSAFTTEGYITLDFPDDYKVYILNDDYFAGSDYLLQKLTNEAVSHGIDVIVSECSMLQTNTFEHLFIPEIKTAFMTKNFFNSLHTGQNKISESIINFNRFYDKDYISDKKQRITFNKKASLELAEEAAISLKTALDIHDKLEEFYINAINFKQLDLATENLINEIKERA